MNIFEDFRNSTNVYKVCVVLVGIFICLLIYSIFNRKNLMNLGNNLKNINENFSNKNLFVMYYVNWCPHCINAKPEFEKLKKNLLKVNK